MTSKAEWVDTLACILRGYHGMGLCPNMLEDCGEKPWESLDERTRQRWEAYAVQVRHSIEVLLAEEREGEREVALQGQPSERSVVFRGIATTPSGGVVRVKRYSDGTTDSEPMPKMIGCARCGGVLADGPGVQEAHRRECPPSGSSTGKE